jgi:hypothetical protein
LFLVKSYPCFLFCDFNFFTIFYSVSKNLRSVLPKKKCYDKYSTWYFIMVTFILFTICGCGKWNLDRVLCYAYPWSMLYYLLLCMYEILTTYVYIYIIARTWIAMIRRQAEKKEVGRFCSGEWIEFLDRWPDIQLFSTVHELVAVVVRTIWENSFLLFLS